MLVEVHGKSTWLKRFFKRLLVLLVDLLVRVEIHTLACASQSLFRVKIRAVTNYWAGSHHTNLDYQSPYIWRVNKLAYSCLSLQHRLSRYKNSSNCRIVYVLITCIKSIISSCDTCQLQTKSFLFTFHYWTLFLLI